MVYLIFSKSELQAWNSPENMGKNKDDVEKAGAEMQPLNKGEEGETQKKGEEKDKDEMKNS